MKATELPELMQRLQATQPLDPLLQLEVFRDGSVVAHFQSGEISFSTAGHLAAWMKRTTPNHHVRKVRAKINQTNPV